MASRFRNTYILLALFIVLLAVVLLFANGGAQKSRLQKGADDLIYSSSEVSAVTAVSFVRGEEEQLRLDRGEGGWKIGDQGVDPDEVEGLLMSVQELTRGKEVSRNEENWGKYGVSAASASAVVLFDGDEQVGRFVIGSSAPGAGKYYLRRGDDATVYEVPTSLEKYTRYDASRWRDKRLFPVVPDDVEAVSVRIGEDSWSFAQQEGSWGEHEEKIEFYLDDITGLRAGSLEADTSLFVEADQAVALTLTDGTEWVVEIDVVGEGESYARVSGSAELLRISADYGVRLRPTFLETAVDAPTEDLQMDVEGLDVGAEGLEIEPVLEQ